MGHIFTQMYQLQKRPRFMVENHIQLNVLAAVDFDLRFTYVLAGWEGSAHDVIVLRDALDRPTGLKVPEGISVPCPILVSLTNDKLTL